MMQGRCMIAFLPLNMLNDFAPFIPWRSKISSYCQLLGYPEELA